MKIIPNLLIVLLISALSGCSLNSDSIVTALKSDDGELSLSSIGPRNWERMCILEPYTSNEIAEAKLGFAWDAESRLSRGGLVSQEEIYLLVFVRDNAVEGFARMPRHEGDLREADRSCFDFDAGTLRIDASGQWVPVSAGKNGG